MDIYQWEGFWFEPSLVGPAMTFRSTFHARNDDVLLASTMKTWTTLLKSNYVSIITQHRRCCQITSISDILTSKNLHYLVPTIESTIFIDPTPHPHPPPVLCPSRLRQERAVQDRVHRRKIHSFFYHMVEYWAKSKKRPDKILFVKYEELKTEPKRHVSKIAEFLGRPYVNGDEGELVEEVLSRCCVERLKNLEVNKNGSVLLNVPNSSFFRKGEVGGWKNYLTAKMEEMIDQTSCIKLEPFGLFL
ncbi:hypothetical protein MIMGU_mgv1a018976mg [Erythranthe guttata]|uniref:Sulfotransferase n=2 Tax=Erythranthe guttata TaxID=4155 RepID=A0A022QKY2_ERYGU|nr:hypothetical protein MIMGU_mgv1a018976mg [Erythranthe guttata]